MKAATAKTALGFQNILFATDFSEAAASAIPYVKEIAKHYGAKLTALHVHPRAINPMTPPETWAADAAAAEVRDQMHREHLLSTFAGIPTEALIGEGDLEAELQAAMEKYQTDLIVIGTRGRTGVSKLLLGSTAEEILRSVTCPVLTVGPHADPAREPNGRIREILYATDFSSRTPAAAAYAVSLAEEFRARLVVLHVIPRQGANDLVMASDVIEPTKALLQRLVPGEATDWCKPDYYVEEGDPAEKILELAHLRDADLIVLGVKPATGVPGAATHLPIATAHKVISQAECPVLTVRQLTGQFAEQKA